MRFFHSVILLVFFFAADIFAFESIEFTSDEKTKVVKVQEGNCTSLLDDESNYEILQISPNQFKISTKALTENSAMLLIDCNGQTFAYGLNFKNKPADNFDSAQYSESTSHPQSYFGVVTSIGPTAYSSMALEAFDGSYDPLSITFTRNYSNAQKPKYFRDSVDLFHHFNLWDLGYGFSRNFTADETVDGFRQRLRLYDYSASASETVVGPVVVARRYFLITPAPFAMSFTYSQTRNQTVERGVERSFFFGAESLTLFSRIGYSEIYNKDLEIDTNRGDLNNSAKYHLGPFLTPGNDSSAYCMREYGCKLSGLVFTNETRLKTTAIDFKYGILPHLLGLKLSQMIYRKDEVSVAINRSLISQPWTLDKYWIDSYASEQSTRANAALHLEYRQKEYFYFVDHDFIVIEPNSNTSQRIFARAGMRHESERWSYGISVDLPYQNENCCNFNADLRWFFDRNIKYMTLAAADHIVEGKVVSELTQEPLANVKIVLSSAEKTIAETSSDKNGIFSFVDVPNAGLFQLTASNDHAQTKKEIEKAITKAKLETTLEINEHYLIRVLFSDPDHPAQSFFNYAKETGDAILSTPGAIYKDNKIYVKKGSSVTLKITPEFLPFDVDLEHVSKFTFDTRSMEDGIVEVKLKSKRP